jgi:hypothetical protein
MKYIVSVTLPVIAILSFSSCSKSPADAAVDAATSGMGPGKSAAVRQTTGYGTGPAEKTKNNATDKIDNITR